jgi:hypothetical protein
MQPQSDHETTIAKAIDAKLLEEPAMPFGDIVVAVAASVGFVLSKSDSQFLVDYAKACRKT